MVKTYILDVSKLPDPKEYPEALFGLEEKRKERIQRCRREEDRKQSFGAGLLLKNCLGERGLRVQDIRYGERGKPEIDGCFFNLSHSQDMVVCVTADAPIGCDIEKTGRFSDGIAKRYFTKKEIDYLYQFEENKRKDEFLRLWTMKESYLKMTGEGLGFPLHRIEFEILDSVKVYRDGRICDCKIKEYAVKGYKLTVCSKELDFEGDVISYIHRFVIQ